MSEIFQVVTRSANIHAKPDRSSEMTSELLFGETVEVVSIRKEWVRVKSQLDGYEGYVNAAQFSDDILEPAYRVKTLQSYIYTTPDFKRPPLTSLPYLSRIALTDEEQEGFAQLEGGGWIWQAHLEPLEARTVDIAATAERFTGTPYLWGGKTSRGLDCSGLVQISVLAAGWLCPRDSRDQREQLGKEIQTSELKRGDFVFFEGHVGVMVDKDHILNATARTMDTRIEKLDEMAAFYDGGILACRRI